MKEILLLILGIKAICDDDDVKHELNTDLTDWVAFPSGCYSKAIEQHPPFGHDSVRWNEFSKCDQPCGFRSMQWTTGQSNAGPDVYHCSKSCDDSCTDKFIHHGCEIDLLTAIVQNQEEDTALFGENENSLVRLSCDPDALVCHAYCAYKEREEDGDIINQWLNYVPSGQVLYAGPIEATDEGIQWGGEDGGHGGIHSQTWDGTFKEFGVLKLLTTNLNFLKVRRIKRLIKCVAHRKECGELSYGALANRDTWDDQNQWCGPDLRSEPKFRCVDMPCEGLTHWMEMSKEKERIFMLKIKF